eukprot:CAMPEP_0119167124 /NCGR_PEP_ID=MMETSP1315-20130426/6339_1 /TAXON_ID=676789 /ORGANISM="Prasinoderma singularis, Strain RCC927" /LENGTH=41 /DNA_ID= /DNA_START= /DNA_END= /DNA_ORIENTATION=
MTCMSMSLTYACHFIAYVIITLIAPPPTLPRLRARHWGRSV